MWKFLACSICFTLNSEKLKILENAQIARKVKLLWDTNQPEEETLFDSYIELSQDFINEIWAYPVPIDLGIIAVIKQSSLALDLYAWLTHRVTYLGKETFISWESIAGQVGSQYKDVKEFKRKAKEALQKICSVWPSLNLKQVRGGIVLMPSSPSVPYKKP
jgi:Plasmid encoded RepA protein